MIHNPNSPWRDPKNRFYNPNRNNNHLTDKSIEYLSYIACGNREDGGPVTMDRLIELGYISQGIDTKDPDFILAIDGECVSIKQKERAGETTVFYSVTPKGINALRRAKRPEQTRDRHQNERRIARVYSFNRASRRNFNGGVASLL